MLVREPIGMEGERVGGSISLRKVKRINGRIDYHRSLSKPPSIYQLIAGNGVFSVLRFDFMAERPLMGDVLRHKRFGPEPTHGPGTAALCFWAPI